MNKKIRVMVVDDECIACEAIVALLEMAAGITVVGRADSAEICVQKAHSLRPDIILLDLHLPDQSGVEVIGALLEDNPAVRIIILSGYAEVQEVAAAFRAGAFGYILKTQAASDLVQIIENVYKGHSYISSRIAMLLFQSVTPSRCTPLDPTNRLSKTERHVLTYVAQGLTNKEIARHLGLRPSTIRGHVNRTLQKLKVKNRTEAALVALKYDLAGQSQTASIALPPRHF
jgi:DNA-binding NarL/FixJ family response regulator